MGHNSVRMDHMLNTGFMKLLSQLYIYNFVYTGLVKSTLNGGLRSKKLKGGMISTTYSHIVRKKLYTYTYNYTCYVYVLCIHAERKIKQI